MDRPSGDLVVYRGGDATGARSKAMRCIRPLGVFRVPIHDVARREVLYLSSLARAWIVLPAPALPGAYRDPKGPSSGGRRGQRDKLHRERCVGNSCLRGSGARASPTVTASRCQYGVRTSHPMVRHSGSWSEPVSLPGITGAYVPAAGQRGCGSARRGVCLRRRWQAVGRRATSGPVRALRQSTERFRGLAEQGGSGRYKGAVHVLSTHVGGRRRAGEEVWSR